jgi:hypothetical protein
MKKRPLLFRLRTNGFFYSVSALLLLVGVPLYEFLLLSPTGYGLALNASSAGLYSAYLAWIGAHPVEFVGYRLLLVVAFALLLSLPFTLYRIIVAQELMRQIDQAEEEDNEEEEESSSNGLPAYAWRGKGFAVLAAWAGLGGLLIYLLGTVASTLYYITTGNGFTPTKQPPDNFAALATFFAINTNTIGIGLLALAALFFGALIARSGRALWPGVWLTFGYAALAVAALLSGSAVGAANSPITGQAPLTVPAVLFFALWILWLGIMLIRLKPE